VTATASTEAIGMSGACDAQAKNAGRNQSCCGASSHRVLRFG
jgi:hypothetical protein